MFKQPDEVEEISLVVHERVIHERVVHERVVQNLIESERSSVAVTAIHVRLPRPAEVH